MTIEEQRKEFHKWLDTTSWKNDSETFHNDLFEAWQACNAQYEKTGLRQPYPKKDSPFNVRELYAIKDKS